MATISTCMASRQARQVSRSAVMEEKVRTCRCTWPSSWVSNTQATTFFLCTSIPQQREYITCMLSLLSFASLQGARKRNTFPSRAHPQGEATILSSEGAPRSPFSSGSLLQPLADLLLQTLFILSLAVAPCLVLRPVWPLGIFMPLSVK